jgi:hypothetical protein
VFQLIRGAVVAVDVAVLVGIEAIEDLLQPLRRFFPGGSFCFLRGNRAIVVGVEFVEDSLLHFLRIVRHRSREFLRADGVVIIGVVLFQEFSPQADCLRMVARGMSAWRGCCLSGHARKHAGKEYGFHRV